MSVRHVQLRDLTRKEAVNFPRLFPHLIGMWDDSSPIPCAWALLRYQADQSVIRWGNGSTLAQSGKVFLIETEAHLSVGITGYWIDPDIADTIRMRWTAISTPFRGVGYAEAALKVLRQEVGRIYPRAQWLSESCPASNQKLIRWFQRQGFRIWPDPDVNGIGIRLVKTISLRIALPGWDDSIRP